MPHPLPRSLALCALSLWLTSCAAGDPVPLDSQDMEDMRPSAQVDMRPPTSPAQDMRALPPVEDMRPAMICTPNMRTCQDAATALVCAPDGASATSHACPEQTLCEQGECVKPPLCTPGEAFCFDASTRQVCRSSGEAYKAEACPVDTACIGGECVSGEVNGSACVAHDDCSGGKCHCGQGTGELCTDAFAQPSYCTGPCDAQSGCAESEWCFSGQTHLITATSGNYNHCVARCQGTCAIEGLSCKRLPVLDAAGELTWEEGCYFAQVKEAGESCEADVECVSGLCLKDYFSQGICSTRCEDVACPQDAACVANLKDNQAWCMPRCVDGPNGASTLCPLDQPDDRLDVTCNRSVLQRGGTAFTCRRTGS